MSENKLCILKRVRIEVNTDPLRRCYNGCHFSSEVIWSSWESLDSGLDRETAERRLRFWRELNDYAVSQRGKGARAEFKIEERESE